MISPTDALTPVKRLSGGRFVVIEGLDGSGGTTQVERLVGHAGRRGEVVRTREPSDGPVGTLIRAQLAGGELGDSVLPYLFAADRRHHLDSVVLPAVARGALVVSDRYALSSFAYQAAALGLDRVLALNADFPAPDLTVFLDLPPEACLDRILRRGLPRDRFETLERLTLIRTAYETAMARTGWPVLRVDAALPAGLVHEAIVEALWPS